MKQHLFSTLFALAFTATAALGQRYDITQGSITFSKVGDDLHVLQGATDDRYVFNNGTFSNITIYGNSTVTEHVILIDTPWTSSGYETLITLSNVLIQSETSIPIELTFTSTVKLFLAPGTSNELTTTGIGCPGIKASDEGGVPKLIIKGSGTLVAAGGESSAGIGGYYLGNAGNIKIEDHVTVIATGGMGGAGIGGGEATAGGEATTGGGITISSNAVVIAQGGASGLGEGIILGGGAGIGGGGSTSFDGGKSGGAGGSITISGCARVTAQGGEFAAGIGGGGSNALHTSTASEPGTISIGPSTKVVAISDGSLPAIHDDDGTLAGNGYVMQLDYYNPKTAGTTNTVLRSGKAVTNIVAAVDYQSIAISLAAASTYRVKCNDFPQESQGDTRFELLQTGLKIFRAVSDTNSLPFTTSTPVEVPYEWLAEYYPSTPENEYEELANSAGANSFAVWESYVAGLVPTNATSTFTASIALTNGTPYISWTPVLEERTYTVQGKTNLSDSAWGPTNSASRFFNVTVEMP